MIPFMVIKQQGDQVLRMGIGGIRDNNQDRGLKAIGVGGLDHSRVDVEIEAAHEGEGGGEVHLGIIDLEEGAHLGIRGPGHLVLSQGNFPIVCQLLDFAIHQKKGGIGLVQVDE